MKKTIILTMIILMNVSAYCQWLTQSADGKGTFLFKGANVAVDLTKTDASFSMNNLSQPVKVSSEKNNSFLFYGGAVNAKNEEGLGNLFSRGDFVPSAKVNLFLGIRLSNSYDETYKNQEKINSDKLQETSLSQINSFISQMKTSIDLTIKASDLDETADKVLIAKIKKDWNTALDKSGTKTFADFLKSYISKNSAALTQIPIVSNIISDLLDEIKETAKKFDAELKKTTVELTRNRDGFVKNNLFRLSLFAFGGIDASSFKRVEEINTTSLSKSFIKEEYRGGNLGVGINYQLASWKFGATYTYKQTNNFNLLDKTDYKLTTETVAGSQTLTQEKPVTAYSGKYGELDMNEFNFDALYTFSLGNEAESYALLNAYLRGNYFTRNKDILPNSYNIGLGTYLFTKKSKFLGGLYVELPDVGNSFEKNKPIADQNIRPTIKRLSFGVIGKFSLNSLISWQ